MAKKRKVYRFVVYVNQNMQQYIKAQVKSSGYSTESEFLRTLLYKYRESKEINNTRDNQIKSAYGMDK
jgi:Arc/MetJ-type ribon-helix-helix transcriptional regulator